MHAEAKEGQLSKNSVTEPRARALLVTTLKLTCLMTTRRIPVLRHSVRFNILPTCLCSLPRVCTEKHHPLAAAISPADTRSVHALCTRNFVHI